MIKLLENPGETIVLFDMDGTLTEARKEISREMISVLDTISQHSKIGIVSGSPYEYIKQQLNFLWSPRKNKQNYIIMPCNGTQVYTWDSKNADFECVYSTDIKSYLAEKIGSPEAAKQKFNTLVSSILSKQIELINDINDLEVSGNFLSYRGSMLNWSMIGRDASHDLRERFKLIDNELQIREKLHNSLIVHMNASGLVGIECALGGTTSIDIYPSGWDKTHALNHLKGADVWFWGDSCGPNGNDRTLFEELGPGHRSFEVTDPSDCIRSLKENLPIDWYSDDMKKGGLDVNSTTGSD